MTERAPAGEEPDKLDGQIQKHPCFSGYRREDINPPNNFDGFIFSVDLIPDISMALISSSSTSWVKPGRVFTYQETQGLQKK